MRETATVLIAVEILIFGLMVFLLGMLLVWFEKSLVVASQIVMPFIPVCNRMLSKAHCTAWRISSRSSALTGLSAW
jgi:hypothetical protein